MAESMAKGALLGRGSYADVHVAFSKTGGRVLALKSAHSYSHSSSLMKEEYIFQLLGNSPYVVDCFQGYMIMNSDGDWIYNLILEYASEGSLRSLMIRRRSGFPEIEVRRYTRMIVNGLCLVHEKGLVHCDMKLDNILVFPDEDGGYKVKIADFGLAKRCERREVNGCFKFQGTPRYMSPESIALGEDESPLDVWSLGCMVIEMCTGELVLKDCKTSDDIILRIVFRKHAPEIPKNLSQEGKDFLNKCFAWNRMERWTAAMLKNHPFVAPKRSYADVCKFGLI